MFEILWFIFRGRSLMQSVSEVSTYMGKREVWWNQSDKLESSTGRYLHVHCEYCVKWGKKWVVHQLLLCIQVPLTLTMRAVVIAGFNTTHQHRLIVTGDSPPSLLEWPNTLHMRPISVCGWLTTWLAWPLQVIEPILYYGDRPQVAYSICKV